MKINFIVLVAFMVFLIGSSNAQDTHDGIKGRVIDRFGQPVSQAEVVSGDGKHRALTDHQGLFEIQVTDGNGELAFAKQGFISKSVKVAGFVGASTIRLDHDAHHLDDYIELGYSNQRRLALSGAASTVSGAVLERQPVANLTMALAGQFPGLTTQEMASELSRANTALYVRGLSFARNLGPLVVIDGIATSYNSNESLDYISPHEIESISLLKDASTQAIYGIQGANGVLVVTTKRGKPGQISINAKVDHAVQQMTTRPMFYTSGEYAKMRNQAALNDGLGENYWFTDGQIAHFEQGDEPERYPNTNWYNRFVKELTSMQRVGVNVSGGNNRITFFSNLNFMHQGGYFNVDQDRYNPDAKNVWVNYRSNVDMNFNEYLSGYLRLSGNVKRERTPGGAGNAGVYGSVFQLPPTMYGPVTPTVTDNETGEIISEGGEVITTELVGAPTYGLLNRTGYVRHTVTNINSQFGLNLDMKFLTPGLKLSGVFAYQTNSVGSLATTQDFERYQRIGNWDELDFVKKGGEQNTPLGYSKGHQSYYHLTYQGKLDYERKFDRHQVNGMAYMYYQNLTKSNLSSPELLPYNRVHTGVELNYGYSDRYFLKGVVGYSASEQYAKNNRYIFTPALSAAWLLSNEAFMRKTQSWLSLLKIRGSWGRTANDQSGLQRYAYLDNIVVNRGGALSYLQYLVEERQTGNPFVRAEISTKTNVGLDIGLFNNLTLHADIFKEKVTNMVVGAVATIPKYQGIPLSNYPRINGGTFENKGYELGLAYTRNISGNLSVHGGAMVAYAKNTIIHMNESVRTADYAYRKRQEGFSHGQAFGYLVDYRNGNGFFNSQQEIVDQNLVYGFGTPRVGDLIYQDLNSDGLIDERDRAPIGVGSIPRLTYSFSGGIKYKQFDLNLLFQGVGQYSSIITGMGIWETSYDGVFSSLHKHAWTPERHENGEKISWPALSLAKSVNHEASDFVNFDRSYLRLKNLEIGYTLTDKHLDVLNLQELRLLVSIQNLFTWDNMKSGDFGPEGGGFTSFPVYRVFNLGINLVL